VYVQVFVAPIDGGSGNSRMEPASLENTSPADPLHNPRETANGEVVVSDLVVSTERRAPEGQDNVLDEELHNDPKATALGNCISVTEFYMNLNYLWHMCAKYLEYSVSGDLLIDLNFLLLNVVWGLGFLCSRVTNNPF
jgi:hypothetical protein